MKKVTIKIEYDLKIPLEMEDFSNEEIIESLNALYDAKGKDVYIDVISEFKKIAVTHIDDKEVVFEGGKEIILDGNRLKENLYVFKSL